MKPFRPSGSLIRFLFALAIVAFAHLMSVPDVSRLWAEWLNAGHIFLMGAFSIVILGLTRDILGPRLPSRLSQYVTAFLLTVAVGGLFELAQIPGPRDADVMDLLRDAVGAFAFLTFFMLIDRQMTVRRRNWALRVKVALPSVALLALILAMIPALRWTAAFHHRDRIFPQLCTFTSPWESLFWTTRNASLTTSPPPQDWSRFDRRQVGRMTCEPSPRSGFAINQAYPDWTGYNALQVPVYLVGKDPAEFFVQIEDRLYDGTDSDRFTFRTEISPGSNQLVVPMEMTKSLPDGRALDRRQIRTVYFFTADTSRIQELYIGAVGLR